MPFSLSFATKMDEFSTAVTNYSTSRNASDQLVIDNETYLEYLETFRQSLHIYNTPTSIVLLCAYILLFIVSFVGNLLVLVVILRNKKLRVFTNSFMINLAVADLFGKSM